MVHHLGRHYPDVRKTERWQGSETTQKIVLKLVQVKVLQGQGSSITDAVRQVGVTQPACYRWRIEYGGIGVISLDV